LGAITLVVAGLVLSIVPAAASPGGLGSGSDHRVDQERLIDEVVRLNQRGQREPRPQSVSWTHDGLSLVVNGVSWTNDRRVDLIDVASGTRRHLADGRGVPSPVDQRIAVARPDGVEILDHRGRQLEMFRVASGQTVESTTLAWRGDGRRFAVATVTSSGVGQVWIGGPHAMRPVRLPVRDAINALSWLGDDLLVTTTNADLTDASLLRCRVRPGSCTLLAEDVPAEGFEAGLPSPDGTRVFYGRDRAQDFLRTLEPAVVDRTGARTLHPAFPAFVQPSSGAWWNRSGTAVSFPCQRRELMNELCTVNLRGRVSTISLAQDIETRGAAVSPDGRRVAYVGSGLLDQSEVRVIGVDGRHDRLVTQLSRPHRLVHATTSTVTWAGPGGLRMDGFLVRPQHVDGDTPLLVDLHGGPMGGISPDAGAIAFGSTAEWQYWAALGYTVFVPTRRDSNLHGIGPLQDMIDAGDWSTPVVGDILAGIDAVVAAGGIDDSRVGVLGHSAGAFLAYQLHARAGDRFRFVIAKGGAHSEDALAPSVGQSVCGISYSYPDDPAECQRRIRTNDALTFIDGATAPLFVPSGGAEEAAWPADYIAALRERGLSVTEHVYPDELHTINLAANQRDLLRRTTAFIEANFR
jgi:dipeptidyl aminopeptidase/acylaminoacyl peptidase